MNITIPAALMTSMMLLLASCVSHTGKTTDQSNDTSQTTTVMKSSFGMAEGKEVNLYTLRNSQGIVVMITNYGAIITGILTPDGNGVSGDIVLGFDSLAPYLQGHPYFGCIAGRFANRIAFGKFTLDGREYQLSINNGPNHLHGGNCGFDKQVWDASAFADTSGAGVIMKLISPDGEEGYPGNLSATVTYTLTDRDELICRIEAVTDKPTPVNLCNHTYFNLNGGRSSVLEHILEINARQYTEVNDQLIPTGNLPSVAGSPMDFTGPHAVGARIGRVPGGYDHNYVLLKEPGVMGKAARLTDPLSGRCVEVYTTQPGIQFYSGNFLDGTLIGKNGAVYQKHWGLCLEAQHFPDSPNQKTFPNTILRPGETFSETTIYRFLVTK